MRNLIIALAVAALGFLAYLAWNTSVSTSSKAEEAPPGAEVETPSAESDVVTPRRMRSRRALSEDTLADPSLPRPRPLESHSQPTNRREERIEKFDSDGDGRLSMAERAAMRAARDGRSKDDALSDEQVATREEARSAVVERRTTQWISDADTDRDGVLSPSEAELGSPRLRRILSDFDAADRDDDGSISQDELKRSLETWRAARRSRLLP